MLTTETYHGVQAMNTTWYEKGIEQATEKERRVFLREVLEDRFGPLSPAVLARLDQVAAERLLPLRQAARQARSLAELGLEA